MLARFCVLHFGSFTSFLFILRFVADDGFWVKLSVCFACKFVFFASEFVTLITAHRIFVSCVHSRSFRLQGCVAHSRSFACFLLFFGFFTNYGGWGKGTVSLTSERVNCSLDFVTFSTTYHVILSYIDSRCFWFKFSIADCRSFASFLFIFRLVTNDCGWS